MPRIMRTTAPTAMPPIPAVLPKVSSGARSKTASS
jgi:hypothetical protein